MQIAKGLLFFKDICSRQQFFHLNISASFLHPYVGFGLAKSKNLTFSSREKHFLLVYKQAVALAVTYWE